jgi:hypothetical protein
MLIAQIHRRCLGNGKGLPALLMLEGIENALEDFYRKLQGVNPMFVQQIQKKKNEERLKEQKKEMMERMSVDRKGKCELIVERARMPIRRRNGRPQVKRMLPVSAQQVDPARLSAAQFERNRIEKMLYEAAEQM